MGRFNSCPVGHTCPDIDAVISVLQEAEERLNIICRMPLKDIENEADEIAAMLRDLYHGSRSQLEELRSANAQLREWGEGLEQGLAEEKAEVQRLEKELDRAIDTIDDLKAA